MAGTPLTFLPAVHATWAAWKKDHSDTLALSFRTGHRRDYSRDPYADLLLDRRQAIVVEVRGNSKIYPFSELRKAGPNISDEIAGEKVMIQFDSREQTAYVKGAQGEPVSSFVVFFADARAFYPHAPVFKAR